MIADVEFLLNAILSKNYLTSVILWTFAMKTKGRFFPNLIFDYLCTDGPAFPYQ